MVTSPPYGRSVHGQVRAEQRAGGGGVEKYDNRYSDDPANLACHGLDDLLAGFTQILAGCAALLRPGGTVVVTARPWRQRGELVDLPGAVLAAGANAGLIPAERCVALLAGLRGQRLIPRPSFFQLDNIRKARARGEPWHLIVHEDVLIFRAPVFPASSARLSGSSAWARETGACGPGHARDAGRMTPARPFLTRRTGILGGARLPDLTARAEPGVHAPGPGREASQAASARISPAAQAAAGSGRACAAATAQGTRIRAPRTPAAAPGRRTGIPVRYAQGCCAAPAGRSSSRRPPSPGAAAATRPGPDGPGCPRPPGPHVRTWRRTRGVRRGLAGGRCPWPRAVAPGVAPRGLDHPAQAERACTTPHGQPPARTDTACKHEEEPGVAGQPDELLTIEEVIAELRVPRSTFYRWRQKGTGPPVMKLPSGAVRIRRTALAEWLRGLEDDPKEHAA